MFSPKGSRASSDVQISTAEQHVRRSTPVQIKSVFGGRVVRARLSGSDHVLRRDTLCESKVRVVPAPDVS